MSLTKQKLEKLTTFLSPEVLRLILICSLIGVANFMVETIFVFVLQIFLINMGLISKEASFLPLWANYSPSLAYIALVLFGLIKSSTYVARQYFTVKTQQVFIKNQRQNLIQFSFIENTNIPSKDIVAAFSELCTQAGNVVVQVSQIIISATTAVFLSLYALHLAPKEFGVGATMLLITGLPLKKLTKKIQDHGRSVVEEFTSLNNSLLLGMKNNFLIKIYQLQRTEFEKGVKFLKGYQKHYLNYVKVSTQVSAFPVAIGLFIIANLTYLGTVHFETDSVKLVAFFYIFIRISQALSDSFRIFSLIKFNYVSFEKLFRLTQNFSPISDLNYSLTDLKSDDEITISVKDLSFKYKKNEPFVFNNISFELERGDIFIIKGRSGTGKSTLLKILSGMVTPTTGEIAYNHTNGVPKNIARHIGYVGTDPYLIPGTVRENLLYGSHLSPDDIQIWECLKYSLAEQFINALPKKLDTVLNESAQLSTGQKQRISIARALLRNPQILICDEATANLDQNTELAIISNLKMLCADKILIIISHKDNFEKISTKKLDL